MKQQEFKKFTQNRVVLVDGAVGSNLMVAGMEAGSCPESWILTHPDVLVALQKEYLYAGTDILYAPTFTSNRIKLAEYQIEDDLVAINQNLVRLSKQAIKEYREESGNNREIYVAGDMTMTGQQLAPIGTLDFEELVNVYKEQVEAILVEGVDLFVVETMMSLQECRAAVLAIKETCELPIMVTLTFQESNRTFYGNDPKTAAIVLESMGVDAVGVNCSTGPLHMKDIVATMKQYCNLPIIAKPNAGLPKLIDGRTKYSLDASGFGEEMRVLLEAGASIVGGCCGTTPEYIRCLKKVADEFQPVATKKKHYRFLTTDRSSVEIKLEGRFLVVGERINPTGKKALQAELREGKFNIVTDMAREQVEQGASILDINMGMNGIDEKEMMLTAISEVLNTVDVPISIDSSHVAVVEAALRRYPGRALINSISLEPEKFEKLIPIAKKYGAMFILLPLSEKGLPENLDEKKEIIRKILDRALACGLSKEDIIVDGLVTTVGANKRACIETLETIRYCKEDLGLATICGLSNISFGLPERIYVNCSFLSMAIGTGLTMAILNPSQVLLMNTAFAADLLNAKEDADVSYIEQVRKNQGELVLQKKQEIMKQTDKASVKVEDNQTRQIESRKEHALFQAVINGRRKDILELVRNELEHMEPANIIEEYLIPAINEVGNLFEQQIYFLPQLISSAEAMKKAIDYLEPMLMKDKKESSLGKVVIATVAGDIHDIGKNLVALMLKNYGFDVIDLGKDVKTEEILKTAKAVDADIIALSALMTTTMTEMKHVVELAKQQELRCKIIIGGAVITESYAIEISADGYSKDAQGAVALVKKILNLI